MEDALKGGLLLLAFGCVLLWIGWSHWRYRDTDNINIIEAIILKIGGADEPLSSTDFDRLLCYAQAFLGFLFGGSAVIAGTAIILNHWGWL
ncbi:MAG: hypothetical protein AAGH53_01205 [Pseudomonadota bacterium]